MAEFVDGTERLAGVVPAQREIQLDFRTDSLC